MRVVVIGGTGFVGRHIVEELGASGHEIVVVHRGVTEPQITLGREIHIHAARSDLHDLWPQIDELGPEALVDVAAYSRDDAQYVLGAVHQPIRLLALSSMDVYRASGALRGVPTHDPAPLDETAPLRESRYIYRSAETPLDAYEKLDVEDEYLRRGATILRLPMIYGEHDGSRREEFVLRRCRANRDRIPVGPGSLLWSRGYVVDIARAVRLALEADVEGEIFNVCEKRTWTIGEWARQIASAAGQQVDFVRVPDDALPDDLRLTSSFEQDLLFDASKARQQLGWIDTDPGDALRTSVEWHLAHPPLDASMDFSDDDRALDEAG